MGEKVLSVCCIFYSVTIIPNGYAYVKSFGVALHSRNTLRERGSFLNEDKTLHLRCHRDRMSVTLFNFLIVPEYAQEVAFDERSES